ncbi:MAG: Ig-like domain-containing protein, partial [Chitinophagales bacterium]
MRLFTIFFLFLTANPLFLEAANESANCNTSTTSTLMIEAVADTVTVLINESVSFNVLENDIGDVYVNSAFNPVYGSISWSVNGNMTYTPDEDYTGPDVFVYQIKDSEDNVASTSVFVNVGGMASTDLLVETFVECGVPQMEQYMVNIRIIGGKPPYEILVYYGDDLTDLFAEQFFLDQPVPFAYGPIFDDLKYAVAIKDSENTIVMDNQLLDYLCMSETGSTCVPETGLEMQLVSTCENGEQSDDVVATGGSGFYNFFYTPNDPFVPHTVVEDSEGCQNILFYHDIPPYTCPVANDDVVNGAYNAPFSLKPLLNDTGEGLYISDLKGLKHGMIQWRPDGILAYFPNDDFVGIDTLEYEITDFAGNTARATILAVVPENDEVQIFWERDCTRAVGEGVYEINFTVAGGKPPYVIDGDFLAAGYRGDEVLSFIKADGENFMLTAIDKDGESISIQEELISCTFLPPPASDFSVYISCVEGDDYGILTALDPNDEFLQNSFEGNNHGDTIPNEETYLVNFHDYDVSFEGTVYCPAIAVDDLYYGHPNFLDLPLTFNPLLNDNGHGLKLVNVESPNHGSVEWWEASGTMNYCSNADFQGVETFDYTVQDLGGNRTSATITIILANPINLAITYERNCFEVNNNGAENYEVKAFVSGGKPPYQVEVNEGEAFEVAANGDSFVFEVANGEGFQIYATDDGAVTHEATVDELEIEACSPFFVQVERDCTHFCETGTYDLGVFVTGGTPPYHIFGSINETLESQGVTTAPIENGSTYEIYVTDSEGNEFHKTGGELPCSNFGGCCHVYEIESIDEIAECLCDGSMVFTFDVDSIVYVFGEWYNDTEYDLVQIGDTIPADAYLNLFSAYTEYPSTHDDCYYFVFQDEGDFSGLVSDFCNYSTDIEAVNDKIEIDTLEPFTIDVLANDKGACLKLKDIVIYPCCGWLNAIEEGGTITYSPNNNSKNCIEDSFVYLIEDVDGNVELAEVLISLPPSDLVVTVERDCNNAESTGIYTLNVLIANGTPPFTISGSINEVLNQTGLTSTLITDGNPYEISVVDSEGNKFFEVGAEIGCLSLCGVIEVENINIIGQCTCNGEIILDYNGFFDSDETVESIDGVWFDGINEVEVGLGDTIPANAVVEISGMWTNENCYSFQSRCQRGLSVFVSSYCTPENYTFEVVDDFASVGPGEDVIINALQNDTGTGLQITQILSPPSCGQIMDANVETGIIIYVADADTECNVDTFVVEIEDDCGNLAEATVTIFIEPGENEFFIEVEKNCFHVAETGTYELTVSILSGTPPFTISGSINEVLEEVGIASVTIGDGNPYEVSVVDATGAEFFEAGGEVSCGHCESNPL